MSIGSYSEVKTNSGMLHIQVSDQDLKAFADLAFWCPKRRPTPSDVRSTELSAGCARESLAP